MTPRRRSDSWGCLLLVGLFCCASCQSVASTFENETGQTEGKPRVFSPRMDYDEWTPLGRGDPLKNNPTFDYVPPVLDRVQYWLDSHTTEPSSAKRDILVLGVTAKKTSPKLPEQMLKFVDGPKFTRSNQQGVPYRNEYTGSTGAEPPKIVRTNSFRNGPSIDYHANRVHAVLSSYNPSSFYDGKTKPYTMMLPPPLSQKDKIASFGDPVLRFNTQTEEGPLLQESRFHVPGLPPKNIYQDGPSFSPSKSTALTVAALALQSSKSKADGPSSPSSTTTTTTTTTTIDPSVSFEKSNLIYQSTQTLSGGWPVASTSVVPLSTATASFVSRPPARFVPDYSRDPYEFDHRDAAASSNHEVVVEQNANIIVDGESGENEEVVVGQKGSIGSEEKASSTTTTPALYSSSTLPPTSFDRKEPDRPEEEVTTHRSPDKMHIVVANSPGGSEEEASEWKKGPVALVMPTNYSEKRTTTMANRSPDSTFVPDDSTATPATTTTTTTMTTTTTTKMESVNEEAYKTSIIGGAPIYPGTNHGSSNRMQQQQQHHPRPAMTMGSLPSHHLGHPQAPLSSMMHQQAWPNHGPMHLPSGMRPNVGLRAPASISMFPPMTHMHAPPPPSASQGRPSQILQDFSLVFPPLSEPPPPPAPRPVSAGGTPSIGSNRHRNRDQDASTPIFGTPTPSPFLPTIASISTASGVDAVENSVFAAADAPTRKPEADVGGAKRPAHETAAENAEIERGENGNGSVTSTWRVTTVPSLTTDPIFSHYKQPAKPISGPMYLIIQGHSKVKTYKPTVSKHGVPVESGDGEPRQQLSKFERFVQESTRRTAAAAAAVAKKKAEEKARVEKLATDSRNDLMSLVESGVGSFATSSATSETV